MEYETSQINVNGKELKCVKIVGNQIQSRNSTHTIVLLDTSGSMNDDSKLENIKRSLTFLMKFLQSSDYISLVTFNSESKIIIDNMKVTPEYRTTFQYAFESLEAEGGTNLSAGLLNVKNIIEHADPNQVSKTGLIILTDGYINEGIIPSGELLRIVHLIKAMDPNISITTIGYGEDHNATLLNEIATNGGGSYNVVNNIEEVSTVFGDVLGGLMTTVAQNVCIDYPVSWKCINLYSKDVRNNINHLYIGDVCSESEHIVLFEDCSSGAVNITGVTISNYSNFTKLIEWTDATNTINTIPYYIAYIRNMIAYILRNIKIIDKEEIRTKLQYIKEYLNTSQVQFHPLTPMLKREIENIYTQLDTSLLNMTMNLQTSAVLALSRGTSAPRRIPQRRHETSNEYDIVDGMNNLNMTTPFSNNIQRELTQRMNTCVEDPQS